MVLQPSDFGMTRDTYKLIENYDEIKDRLDQQGNVYSRTKLIAFLDKLIEETNVLNTLSYNRFTELMLNELGLLTRKKVLKPNNSSIIYIYKEEQVSPYEIAVNLSPNSYLSHYSSLYLTNLTLENPKKIFINKEQSPKMKVSRDDLEQKNVDYAFSKKPRITNNKAYFTHNQIVYEVYMLNGMNTNELGVIKIHPFNFTNPVKITDFERTLIDITMKPIYSGGIEEVIEVYKKLKHKVSISKVIQYLDVLDHIYPYEQSVLFYLNKSNYSKARQEKIINYIKKKKTNKIKFYLDNQLIKKKLDELSNVYYPSYLDSEEGEI